MIKLATLKQWINNKNIIMKNFSLILLFTILISSCATIHTVPFFNESPPIENNFKHVKNVVGKSQATYIFGIGGLLGEDS